MPTPSKTLTAETAALHEALYLRLATFARQTETSANKHPDASVSATARKLAEALLFDARRFIGPRGAMPVAAPDLAGLASQLGQALAGLEAFEGQHSFWDDVGKCFVWALPEQQTLPVRRLKPKVAPRPARDTAKMNLLRHKPARRIDAKAE